MNNSNQGGKQSTFLNNFNFVKSEEDSISMSTSDDILDNNNMITVDSFTSNFTRMEKLLKQIIEENNKTRSELETIQSFLLCTYGVILALMLIVLIVFVISLYWRSNRIDKTKSNWWCCFCCFFLGGNEKDKLKIKPNNFSTSAEGKKNIGGSSSNFKSNLNGDDDYVSMHFNPHPSAGNLKQNNGAIPKIIGGGGGGATSLQTSESYTSLPNFNESKNISSMSTCTSYISLTDEYDDNISQPPSSTSFSFKKQERPTTTFRYNSASNMDVENNTSDGTQERPIEVFGFKQHHDDLTFDNDVEKGGAAAVEIPLKSNFNRFSSALTTMKKSNLNYKVPFSVLSKGILPASSLNLSKDDKNNMNNATGGYDSDDNNLTITPNALKTIYDKQQHFENKENQRDGIGSSSCGGGEMYQNISNGNSSSTAANADSLNLIKAMMRPLLEAEKNGN